MPGPLLFYLRKGATMQIGESICIKDWHIEAENGDRQECRRGKTYTTTKPENGEVTVFSRFWVKAPADIFAGWQSLYDKRIDAAGDDAK
jgi:hypothetical protein